MFQFQPDYHFKVTKKTSYKTNEMIDNNDYLLNYPCHLLILLYEHLNLVSMNLIIVGNILLKKWIFHYQTMVGKIIVNNKNNKWKKLFHLY